jgi:hypothetical protein
MYDMSSKLMKQSGGSYIRILKKRNQSNGRKGWRVGRVRKLGGWNSRALNSFHVGMFEQLEVGELEGGNIKSV